MLGYLVGLSMSQHLYKLGGNYLSYISASLTSGVAIFHLWAIRDMGILEENKHQKREINLTVITNKFTIYYHICNNLNGLTGK